jgi:F0F1-type ATP synthase membrane subunit b/b'
MATLNNLIIQLGIDHTLWTQLVVFVAFYCWVRFVFFPPFLRLIEARKAMTLGLVSQTAELNKQAEAKELELSLKVADVKKQAAAEREKEIASAKAVAHQKLEFARKSAKLKLEQSRVAANNQQDVEMGGLKSQANEFSDILVDKLIKEGTRV